MKTTLLDCRCRQLLPISSITGLLQSVYATNGIVERSLSEELRYLNQNEDLIHSLMRYMVWVYLLSDDQEEMKEHVASESNAALVLSLSLSQGLIPQPTKTRRHYSPSFEWFATQTL